VENPRQKKMCLSPLCSSCSFSLKVA
jgi:hypothetical protein